MFWQRVIIETLDLCSELPLDPAPLHAVQLGEHKHNLVDRFLGLRQLLDPDMKRTIDGQILQTSPSPTDHLMGHLLWGMPLSFKNLPVGPTLTVHWHVPPGERGSFSESRSLSHELNATEQRGNQKFLKWVQTDFKHDTLLDFAANFKGTQEQCWKAWNLRYSYWKYSSRDTMWKRVYYWRKKRVG